MLTSDGDLRPLTAVRGIAAWMVVLYHIRLSIAGLPPAGVAALSKGYLAVDFFFLLSGFVIWLRYADRLRGRGLVGIGDFLRRRIARVWPLHVAILGYAVAVALLLAATGRHDPQAFPFAQLPLHLLLIQNWGFADDLTWNVPAWSISCEAAAYLLFPALIAVVDWRRMLTAVILLSLAGLFGLLHLAMSWGGAGRLGDMIPVFGVLRCLIEFTAGTACCALWMRWRPRGRIMLVRALAIGTGLSIAALAGLLPETLAIPAGFSALLIAVALSAGLPRNPLDHPLLQYLGEISYATYLSHFMLFFSFKLAFVADAHAVPIGQVIAYLVLVLIVSIALYHLVERPAQRAINRPRRRRPAPATA